MCSFAKVAGAGRCLGAGLVAPACALLGAARGWVAAGRCADLLATSLPSLRSLKASKISVKPYTTAQLAINHSSDSAPSAGCAMRTKPSTTETSPPSTSHHSPLISWRKRMASTMRSSPVPMAQTATYMSSAKAVMPGATKVSMATPMPRMPSSSSTHQCSCCLRPEMATHTASMPSLRVYAPKSKTSAAMDMPGWKKANMPKPAAMKPRSKSIHQLRAKMDARCVCKMFMVCPLLFESRTAAFACATHQCINVSTCHGRRLPVMQVGQW